MGVYKKITKNSLITLLVVSLALGLIGPITAHAATAPDLGLANSYSIFGKSAVTNTGAGTHLWGNVGADLLSNITGLTAGQVDGTMAGPVAGVQTAATAAYTALDAWGADGAKNLSTPQTVAPGVWTLDASQTLTGAIVLSGAGVYIFRSNAAYTVANGATVTLTNGATACNVFWEIPGIMTIGTTAQMVGTIITNSGAITIANGATLQGRALSLIANVTLDTNQVTNPCLAATPTPGSSAFQPSTINVVKTVINDNGRTKVVADFPLFVNGTPVVSGVTNTFPAINGIYTVTETGDPNYTRTFSGDCDANGQMNLTLGQNKFCIITNNDIGPPLAIPLVPPLIDVVKTASPLSLPNGPGPVVYTYTLRNIGTVPVSNVTMVGDTCSPIVLSSGDTNNDLILQVNETWVYKCNWNLTQTHTNTVVATGWANGISAIDIASATVIVGAPIVPPLIHVVKVPSVFVLPAGGGAVTYSYDVTNPGTVPLSNISIADDKCTGIPGRYNPLHPGDVNQNGLLDPGEKFHFTCQSDLTQTTTNTATATGTANGLTARDFAVATVVVAAVNPILPSSGVKPDDKNNPWDLIILASIFAVLLVAERKQLI